MTGEPGTTEPAAGDASPEARLADVVLHVGTMKTGTSYLQQVLTRNGARLEQDGVRYATQRVGSGPAVRSLLAEADEAFELDGAWTRLAQVASMWNGRTVVISNEMLSFVPAEVASRVVESLRPQRVTVVITARDLVRLLPSAWQNKVKHGRGWGFHSFVENVMKGDAESTGPGRSFWHHHDLVAILDRWIAAAGRENVVLVTVPRSGAPPTLLWQRFARVLGVDGDQYDAAQDRRSNLSMGYLETELLRRVNREIRTHLDPATQKRLVLGYLANEVLRPDPDKPDDRTEAVLTSDAYEWAVQRSRAIAAEVTSRGVTVIGSVDELIPLPRSAASEARTADPVPTVSSGTVRAVVALLRRVAELEETQSRRPIAQASLRPNRRGRPAGGRRGRPADDAENA